MNCYKVLNENKHRLSYECRDFCVVEMKKKKKKTKQYFTLFNKWPNIVMNQVMPEK